MENLSSSDVREVRHSRKAVVWYAVKTILLYLLPIGLAIGILVYHFFSVYYGWYAAGVIILVFVIRVRNMAFPGLPPIEITPPALRLKRSDRLGHIAIPWPSIKKARVADRSRVTLTLADKEMMLRQLPEEQKRNYEFTQTSDGFVEFSVSVFCLEVSAEELVDIVNSRRTS